MVLMIKWNNPHIEQGLTFNCLNLEKNLKKPTLIAPSIKDETTEVQREAMTFLVSHV